MTIQEIYNKWLPVKRKLVKESTCSTYVYQFTQKILPIYGDKDPEYVTNDEMQRFMLSLIEEGLSVKTAKDIFISFKMLLYYAMERFGVRYIKYSVQFPTANMEATKDLEVYTEFEQKKIISYIVDYPKPKRLGILIGLCTGMRIGEICGLRWENIDVDNKCIHVTHTIERIMDIDTRKTKVIESTPKTIESRRDIPIGRDLLGILKKFKACYNDSFYVTTGDEKFCEPRVYRNYYRHLVLNEVGLDRCIKFHGLRHSFATRMIASKADMKTTSRILGHSDVSTTMNLYVHPSMDDKLDAINKSMKNLFK